MLKQLQDLHVNLKIIQEYYCTSKKNAFKNTRLNQKKVDP